MPTMVSRTPQRLTRIEDGEASSVRVVRMIEADITNIPELKNIPMISFLEGEVSDQKPEMTIYRPFQRHMQPPQ